MHVMCVCEGVYGAYGDVRLRVSGCACVQWCAEEYQCDVCVCAEVCEKHEHVGGGVLNNNVVCVCVCACVCVCVRACVRACVLMLQQNKHVMRVCGCVRWFAAEYHCVVCARCVL